MLLFLPTDRSGHAPVPPEGLRADAEPFRPLATLDAARAAARQPDGRVQRILVLDAHQLDIVDDSVDRIPREAVLNVDPDGDTWRPEPVEAGGGYVVRRTKVGIELLLIHRRGVWDLPKGKLDPGETPEIAAVREVSEEVGIELATLSVLGVLPPTVHGYIWPKREIYAVKVTHWYAMTTTAETFEPEEREGIEAVAYMPWRSAADLLGYESLRQHHADIDPDALGI
ncbi:MAG: hypothetical protein Rubg2KO_36360 [Rubricoccaceae bacterium]